MKLPNPRLQLKLREALAALLPVTAIVLVLCFSVVPVSPGVLLSFLVGALFVTAGMMLFSLGAEMSMTLMGEKVGARITRTKKRWLIALLSFLLGFLITVSEPDLQVLAALIPSVPSRVLVAAVAAGVGLFLMLAMLRMFFRAPLSVLLAVFYAAAFVLVFFVPEGFRAIAFDAGGVTTGPMTVPFIMALGVGVASIRDDENAADDSFGLVALCSIGPILAVLCLGLLSGSAEEGAAAVLAVPSAEDSVDLWLSFARSLPSAMGEIALSLLPVVVFFGVFQLASLRLTRRSLLRILIGLAYTYAGLVLFLTGANVGFLPAGSCLGSVLAGTRYRFLLIPIGALVGFFIVRAEPAVYVLNHQVEEITRGMISSKAMGVCLSVGVALSVALAMTRVLTGVSLLVFLIPGYALALVLSAFVPRIFTAVAFDSGGVASGPMTAAFLLPLARGACLALGRDPVRDAFGVVAMVAMTPLVTVQVLGVVCRIRERNHAAGLPAPVWEDDDAIIEL